MASAPGQLNETPKAASAFEAYVALGEGRSLRALAEQRVRQGYGRSTVNVLRVLERWSSDYHWQARIKQAATDRANAMLEEAANIDSDTFLQSSRILNERMQLATSGHVDMVVKIRESVRKPTPKSGTSVNVNVSVEVREWAERIAREEGLDADQLIADAERIASGAWGKA